MNKVVGSPNFSKNWNPPVLYGTLNPQGQLLGYSSQWCKVPSSWRKCSIPTSWWWWTLSYYPSTMTSFWFLFFFLLIIWKDLYIVCLSNNTSMSECRSFLACEAKLPSPQVSSDIITKRYFVLDLLGRMSLLIFSLWWESGLFLKYFLCSRQGIL